MEYKLLTPGPLTTSKSVKQAMLTDSCTWDVEYKKTVEYIRKSLLEIAKVNDDYTSVLMQGSGTFSVESTINTLINDDDQLLVLANGAYGERIYEIACKTKKQAFLFSSSETDIYDVVQLENYIIANPNLTHLAVVHCETTTGILNNIQDICKVANKYNLKIILDAMSSFGAIEIDFYENNIMALISSANKCLEGVPGFAFVIVKQTEIVKSKGNACSVSLDLYEQWTTFENDKGKWRFTSPTHTVLAFAKALEEYQLEGGLVARNKRYALNQKTLINEMSDLGFRACINEKYQSPIITTFHFPIHPKFTFDSFYQYLKKHGYIIYPGKLSKLDVFRIGNIGQIYQQDIIKLCKKIKKYIYEELD